MRYLAYTLVSFSTSLCVSLVIKYMTEEIMPLEGFVNFIGFLTMTGAGMFICLELLLKEVLSEFLPRKKN